MGRVLAIVVLANLGIFVWVVGGWARGWVLGVEAPALYGIVAGAGVVLPALGAGILRFVFGRPKMLAGYAGSSIVLNGAVIAALLFGPSPAPSADVPEPVVVAKMADAEPPPAAAPKPPPVDEVTQPVTPPPAPPPEPPKTDTFYRYESNGEMHIASRLEDVPVALRSKAVPMTMARPERREPPPSVPSPSPSPKAPVPPVAVSPITERMVSRLGDHRVDLGLGRVVLDPAKTRAAQQHADYLVLNLDHPSAKGLGMHGEQKDLPGWTAEGARAGMRSVIALQEGHPHMDPVDSWMGTFFHRIPLVHPSLETIGVGYAERGRRRVYVLDPHTRAPRTDVVIVPADGATNVPRAFSGDELPNPIPDDADGLAGYPITVSFPPSARVQDVRVELSSATRGFIPSWTSTPEAPVVAKSQQNTVCVMAKDQLGRREKYRFSITARVDGRMFSKRTTFTTE